MEIKAWGSAMPVDGFANLSYNSASNRITTAGFEYDAAGNQTRAQAQDGSWLRYEYDSANRLSVVKTDGGAYLQAYQYSPSNGRLMNQDYISGEFILYANVGGTTLAEYREYTSQIPTWTKSYVYLGSRLLSTTTPNGQGGEFVEYNHPDRLGTRLITNQATGTVYEQTHLPFGTPLDAESTITNNNRRFTSYDRSSRTGLDYAVNRHYDSKQGRFTRVDPIGMAASNLANPQSLNMYAYVGNDPINYTDPSGLFMLVERPMEMSWLELCWRLGICGNPRPSPSGGGEEFPAGGGDPGSSKTKDNCGVNPVTGMNGIRDDRPGANGLRKGGLGNIRPGNGGLGGFRERKGGRGHDGTDIVAPVGTQIVASMSGIVVRVIDGYGLADTPASRAAQNGSYGNAVTIQYENGMYGYYAHLTEVYVNEGMKINQGSRIGTAGRTGNANNDEQPSQDDHLHYGRFTGTINPTTGRPYNKNQWINPVKSLNACLSVSDGMK